MAPLRGDGGFSTKGAGEEHASLIAAVTCQCKTQIIGEKA